MQCNMHICCMYLVDMELYYTHAAFMMQDLILSTSIKPIVHTYMDITYCRYVLVMSVLSREYRMIRN